MCLMWTSRYVQRNLRIKDTLEPVTLSTVERLKMELLLWEIILVGYCWVSFMRGCSLLGGSFIRGSTIIQAWCLSVKTFKNTKTVHVHSECTDWSFCFVQSCSIPNYSIGDVTLLVVNTHHSSAALILLNSLNDKAKDVYFLTPLNYDIRSK